MRFEALGRADDGGIAAGIPFGPHHFSAIGGHGLAHGILCSGAIFPIGRDNGKPLGALAARVLDSTHDRLVWDLAHDEHVGPGSADIVGKRYDRHVSRAGRGNDRPDVRTE